MRSTQSVAIENVRDAEYAEDLLDRVFGTGDIHIEGELGTDAIAFDDAPEADALLRAVRDHAR